MFQNNVNSLFPFLAVIGGF